MMGFGIDQIQAEYVAEIKLRNINREYILKRTAETEELEQAIEELEATLNNRRKLRSIIIDELRQVSKKYPSPRKSIIVYADEIEEFDESETVEDYPVTLFLSREGYFKKITAQSLRMSGEQKYKEGDGLMASFESSNRRELLILTDRQQMYKCRVSDFEDGKASALGVYLPTKLQMDEGESVLAMLDPLDYKGQLLLFFENGKAARIELSAYETKTNRRKLVGAYSDKSPVRAVLVLREEADIAVEASDGRCLVLTGAAFLADTPIRDVKRYRVRSIPAAGALLKPEDRGEEQMTLTEE